jgi:DHA2 family methylenomycin A resistance protein-like MFS transporter
MSGHAAAPGAISGHALPRWTLAATSISYTIVLLDASILNVALNQISDSLEADIAGLQWVVNAYTLTFASLLMTGGTLGDRLGPRNIYLVGLNTFMLASALSGCATNLMALVAARVLQGVGSAMLVPCSLALINRAYPKSADKAFAVSIWMGCGGIAMASGPLVGGALIHLAGWRSIFFVNVPIALVGVWLTLCIPGDGTSRSARHFDPAGQITAIVALGTLIAVLIEGPALGWTSLPIVTGVLTSCVAWIIFFTVEARERHPMLPLSFFGNSLFSASTFVSMVSAFVFYGLFFAFSLYYQRLRGYSPMEAGIAFLPMTAMVAAGGLGSSHLVRLFGPRWSMCGAFGLYAAGSLGMLLASVTSPDWVAIAPLLAIGLASGFISPAATSPALGTVETNRAAAAAAVLNSARQTGSALGVAIFGTLLGTVRPFETAMHAVLGTAATISLGAVLVWWMAVGNRLGQPRQS